MLADLGAALIVCAVTHVVMVVALAWRPHAGPAFAVLTALCGAGAGCVVGSSRCRSSRSPSPTGPRRTSGRWSPTPAARPRCSATRFVGPTDCSSSGGPFCTYPWFAFNGTSSAFTYGADYPGTKFDYGQAAQFATTMQCGGPFGPGSTYCDTVISPAP